ncbi:MAG: hypothetical protein WBK91_00345 [Alphaproteobacteria bacterium]
MSNLIDITGIDKPYLLMKLFNAAAFYIRKPVADWKPNGITTQEARLLLLKGGTDVREVIGRNLHVSLGGNTLNPARYDKANGEGAAQAVVEAIRADMQPLAAFRPAFSGKDAANVRRTSPNR